MDNNIYISETDNIKIEQFNMITANTGFYHEDRIAKMYVMIYVLSGTIYVSEDGTDYELKADDMLILKKGSHQYGIKKTSAGTSWIYAHFQIVPEENGMPEKYSLIKYANFAAQHDIRNKLKSMYATICLGRPFDKKKVAMQLQTLLLDIWESSTKKQENVIVSRINAIVDENLCRRIYSEDLEKELHLTYKYMNKIYKLATGKCIMQYHSEQRIKAAAEILKTSDRSIEETAAEFGYEDPLYFSKCFKKQTGMSPREYRRNLLML